jgi:hypothetical protein
MISTHAALDAVDNRVTYRQLDYWLRTRRIVLDDKSRGSGHHRIWSPVEVAALQDFVHLYETHRDMTALIADGSAWESCLERNLLHVVRGES